MSDKRVYLIQKLESIVDDLGKVPTTVDMAKHGDIDPVVYHDEFDSWDAALREAGLNPNESSILDESEREGGEDEDGPDTGDRGGEYTHISEARAGLTPAKESMLEDIRNFYELHSRVPTKEDVVSTAWMAAYEEYERAFGGVLKGAQEAGIVNEESHHSANKTSEADAEELLDEVRRYHSLYGEIPTADNIDSLFWTHSVSVYLEEFGDWETVLSEVGFS